MHRPENVKDAIVCQPNGFYSGRYMNHELVPAFQSIFSVCNEGHLKSCAFEGLVRGFCDGVSIQPADFFACVSRGDMLFVNSLCLALHIRNYSFAQSDCNRLFVNIDPFIYQSIDQLELELGFTIDQLGQYGLSPEMLVVELLESVPYSTAVLVRMREFCSERGVQFALDDYGQAESNFERYKLLNPDIVKLDAELVRRLCRDPRTVQILKTTIGQFQELGAQVLVEGIESQSQLEIAIEANADMFQGYHLDTPHILPHQFITEIGFSRHAVAV